MTTNPSREALLGSLTVISAYVLVRAGIYHFFPATSLETWFVRDTWMSIPRLTAFGALLFLNQRWKLARFGMPLRDASKAAMLGFVPLALWFFYFSGGHGQAFPVSMKVVGFFTSLVVGLFEEYAFRGPFLSALSRRFNPFTAILLSNILFAAYHIQAQPIPAWPIIFLSGVVFANLRLRGLSLGWLALLHGLADACFFLFPSLSPQPFGSYGLVLLAGLLIYAVIMFPTRRDDNLPA